MEELGYLAIAALTWVVLLLPGWAIAWCAGLRRTDAVLTAAPISLTLLVLTASTRSRTHLPFTPGTTIAIACAVAAVAGAVSLLRGVLAERRAPAGEASRRADTGPEIAPEPDRSWDRSRIAGWLTLGLLGLVVVSTVLIYLQSNEGTLNLPSQTWDAPAHINAIQRAFLTQSADPSDLLAFAYGSSDSFYPPAFTTIGTAAMWAGAPNAIVASNIAAILVAGWIWPSCIAILTRVLLGRGMVVTSSAVLLATIGWNMPWAPLGWGVLWPTATGFAVGPVLVAAVAVTLGFGRGIARPGGILPSPIRVAVGLAATALAGLVTALGHPRALVPLVIPCLAVLLGWALDRHRALRKRAQSDRHHRFRDNALGWALIAGVLTLSGGVLRFLLDWATTSAKLTVVHWSPDISIRRSLVDQLLGSPAESSTNLVAAALVVLGLVAAAMLSAHRWLIVGWAVAVGADAITLSNDDRFATLTRWWYNDHHRITEVIAYFSVPLMSLGVLTVHRWLTARSRAARLADTTDSRPGPRPVRSRPADSRPVTAPLRLIAVLVAIAVVSAVPSLTYLRNRGVDYATDPVRGLLSEQESSFLARVGAIVTADGGGRVLNNPADGSALLYGYTGVETVFMTSYPAPSTRFGAILRGNLITNANRAQVCQELATDDIRWVVNMGPTLTDYIIQASPAPGMQIPPGFWATTEVAREGQAVLYRITGCPGGRPAG